MEIKRSSIITLSALGIARAGEFNAGEVHGLVRLLDSLGVGWMWVLLAVGGILAYNFYNNSKKK